MRAQLLLAVEAQLVSAIEITEPSSGSIFAKGQPNIVEWDSVSSDPSTFNLFIVNYVTYPPLSIKLASDVQTSTGSIPVAIPCDMRSDNGFQI